MGKRKNRSNQKPKKVNVKLRNPLGRNPLDKLSGLKKEILPHIITVLALFPLLIALWIAFPTFELKIRDSIYQFSGIQPYIEVDQTTGESTVYNRIGFTQGADLQGGVNLKFEIQEPETSTGSTTDEQQENPEGETGTGDIAIGKTEEEKKEEVVEDAVDVTVEVMRKRLDSLDVEQSRFHTYTSSGGNTQIGIDMTGRRESIGLLPYYFALSGNEIEILVDDPEYVVPDENSQEQFNIFEALKSSGLSGDDIAGVKVINDQKTNGPGLRVSFRQDAVAQIQLLSANLVRFGFVLSIDGQPLGFQSYPYDPNHPDILYMTDGYGLGDEDTFKAIASVINGEKLPLSVNVLTNNNIEPVVNVDIENLKLALFISFVVVNVVLFALWKYKSIPVIVLNINTLVLSVAALKLLKVPLSMNLIFGVFLGVSFVVFLSVIPLSKLLRKNKIGEELIKENTEQYMYLVRNVSFLVLFFVVGLETFGIDYLGQITMGITAVVISGLIGFWTVYRVFINEIFILPNKLNNSNNAK